MSQIPPGQTPVLENSRREAGPVVDECLFRAAFHNSPAMKSIVRMSDSVLLEVNEAFTRALGYTREEVIGKTPFDFDFWVTPERLHVYREMLETKGFVRDFETDVRARDQSIHTVLLSSKVVEINGEHYSVTAGVDITARKKAEAELRVLNERQEEALQRERELSQLRSDFVSVVSHEFRTPLEIIMSSADNLDRYHDRLAPEKRAQLLRTIHRSVRRMAGMMEEVLLLGRLETDRVTFKPAAFDLHAFCHRVCEEIESTTAARCPIRFEADGTLEAFGDENVLRHILTNLLSNAVKYSPAGEPVEFVVKREGDIAVFRVIDRGCGIPEPDQKRLFQAFHRGSNVRQVPGTGLGLLIVQRCVSVHDGEIEFQSSEGKGTTFTVKLPLFGESLREPGFTPKES